MEATEGMLEDTFRAFSNGTPEMDGRAFVKCVRDAGLLDAQFKVVDVDLIFAKCKPKGGRKIDFVEFQDGLAMIADRKRISDQEVIDSVCCAAGPNYETKSSFCSATFETSGIGPERFYYDRSTYTGVHKNGGPKTWGDIVTDSSLVDRGHDLDDALHRKKAGGRELPTLLGGPSGTGSATLGSAAMSVTSSRGSKATPGSTRLRRPRSPEGMERHADSGRHAPPPPTTTQPAAVESQEVSFTQQALEQQHLHQQLQQRMVMQQQQQPIQLQLPPAPPTTIQCQGGYPVQMTATQPQRYTYTNRLPVASQIASGKVQMAPTYSSGLVSTFAGSGSLASGSLASGSLASGSLALSCPGSGAAVPYTKPVAAAWAQTSLATAVTP